MIAVCIFLLACVSVPVHVVIAWGGPSLMPIPLFYANTGNRELESHPTAAGEGEKKIGSINRQKRRSDTQKSERNTNQNSLFN